MVTLQSMMHGWYLVLTMVANGGMKGMRYPSSVWVLERDDLADQLAEYTNVPRRSLDAILDLVTFGSNGILNPDLNELFRSNDQQLVQLLGIDSAYDFLSAVGSVNWIGMADVQDPSISIVKVWHLMGKLKEKVLPAAMSWLRQRDYLPRPGRDFNVVSFPIKVGDWSAD